MIQKVGGAAVATATPSARLVGTPAEAAPNLRLRVIDATVITEVTPVGYKVTGLAVEYNGVVDCQWPLGTARGRPAEMPVGGHENCPVMANRSAHQGLVASAMRGCMWG